MKSHEFRLIFADKSDLSLDEADALYEAGCDDATFGGSQGVVYGIFHREADTLEQAFDSAIADITAAGFQVDRVEIEVGSRAPLRA